jgi:hypothetical protein
MSGGTTSGVSEPPGGVTSSDTGGPNNDVQFQAPNAEKSWLEWDVHVVPIVRHNVTHVALGGETVLQPDSQWRTNDAFPFSMRKASKTPSTHIGYNGASVHDVVIYGKVRRMHYPIARPRLVTFAGLPVFEKNAVFDMWTEPSSFGQPVNCMKFLVAYGMLSAGVDCGPLSNFMSEQENT